MLQFICRLIFRLRGWKVDKNLPSEIKKCVIIAAPHTSNWDFCYAMAAFSIYKLRIRFTVKKEWMRFPFSLVMKPLGAIAIDRSPRTAGSERLSFTDAMADLFRKKSELVILITPEGTRGLNDKWKTGFFYTAKQANVPICLGFMDYNRKVAGINTVVYPTDLETTMKQIMNFYKNIHPKFPEKFSLDKTFQ